MSHLKQQLSEVREIIKCESDNAPKSCKNDITYSEKHTDTLSSEAFFLREELKRRNLLIKTILNKPESVSRDQHTLRYCKYLSQSQNINETAITSVQKIDLTETKKSRSFKERQTDKNKKEIKQIQKVQDIPVEIENTSTDATLDSSQQETTETQTVTLMEETYPRNGLSSNKDRNEKRVVLLDDSTLKCISGYELSNQVEKGKIYVKSFSGSKTRCMEDHTKPTNGPRLHNTLRWHERPINLENPR